LVLPAFNPQEVTVLIVDDNPDDIQSITRALDRAGLDNAYVCERGEEAVTWLKESAAQVMVMEYRLPGMNGEQLLERLKEMERLPPTIALTHRPDLKLAVNLMKAGALDYLVKDDYLSSALVRSIQNLLRKQKQLNDKKDAEALLSGEDRISLGITEAQWLLKAYKGPFGTRFPQPGERDDQAGSWSEVVDAFRAFIETSLRIFPDVVKRDEDQLVRMVMQRGLSPRDTVTLYQLALYALRRPDKGEIPELRANPGVILNRILARLMEEYQRTLSEHWLRSVS
jgi:FixJ family two-component response regulator